MNNFLPLVSVFTLQLHFYKKFQIFMFFRGVMKTSVTWPSTASTSKRRPEELFGRRRPVENVSGRRRPVENLSLVDVDH